MKPKNQSRLLTVFVLAFATFLQTATARLWTPEDTATVAWYDAADISSVLTTNEISVTHWLDKSGNGNDLEQLVPSQQPTYTASDSLANNKPSIFSDETQQGLEIVGVSNITFGAIYAVTYQSDGMTNLFGNYCTILCNSTNDNANQTWERSYRILGIENSDRWLGSNSFDEYPSVNGGAESRIALPMPLTMFRFFRLGVTQPITIGFNQETGSRGWNGGYCEFVFTDGTENAETVQQIEGYLAWKWDIQAKLPTDHLYFNTRPTTPDAGSVLIIR